MDERGGEGVGRSPPSTPTVDVGVGGRGLSLLFRGRLVPERARWWVLTSRPRGVSTKAQEGLGWGTQCVGVCLLFLCDHRARSPLWGRDGC